VMPVAVPLIGIAKGKEVGIEEDLLVLVVP
jgi:hypothetical protein